MLPVVFQELNRAIFDGGLGPTGIAVRTDRRPAVLATAFGLNSRTAAG